MEKATESCVKILASGRGAIYEVGRRTTEKGE